MRENTEKIISIQNKILETLNSKDPSTMTITELDDFSKAVAAASSITTETMSDMVERVSKNLYGALPIDKNNNIKNQRIEGIGINKLEDTVDLMKSDDYKDRLKAEYWQTKIRLESLEKTIKSMELNISSKTLSKYNLLVEQSIYMKNYLDILYRRAIQENISLFQQDCCCCVAGMETALNYNFPFNFSYTDTMKDIK